jgi:hypothetical protein
MTRWAAASNDSSQLVRSHAPSYSSSKSKLWRQVFAERLLQGLQGSSF